jgi:hypothetical protein
MPAGEIQIVARGQENIFLSADPQITFFKIVYRRYTNFSIETVKTDFLYPVKFGKTFTCELSKIGDLLNNIWIIIELPDIPLIYNFDNEIDEKIKFKWARKIAYALIDYVDIDIHNNIHVYLTINKSNKSNDSNDSNQSKTFILGGISFLINETKIFKECGIPIIQEKIYDISHLSDVIFHID